MSDALVSAETWTKWELDSLFSFLEAVAAEGRNAQPIPEQWTDDQAHAAEVAAQKALDLLRSQAWLMVTEQRRQAERSALETAVEALDVIAMDGEAPQNSERAMARIVARSVRRMLDDPLD